MKLKNIPMKLTNIAIALAATISFSSAFAPMVEAANISRDQLIEDITYLASDELKGRATFSKEIDQAADYISQRFKAIGLVPLAGESSFKQTFTVSQITTASIAATINGENIANENISVATSAKSIAWNNNSKVTKHFVSANDNMRKVLQEINQLGGQHLVVISSAHKDLFSRYKAYFSRGLTKLSTSNENSLVLINSDLSKIDSYQINVTSNVKSQSLTNVVGVLPAITTTKEKVLFSGHYDHLGIKGKDEDNIYNGADDDASGTSAVINLAQYFSQKANNKRELVFSAFTAEEIGGYGSKYFSTKLNPEEIVAMINIEMIGKPSKFGAGKVWMTGMERSSLGELLNSQLPEANKIEKDPYPKQRLFYRSDNATLARLGVPAHSFSSTQLDKDKHYHKASDDIASLDLDSYYQVVENLSIATKGLVDGSLTPSRVDTSQVKKKGKIY